MNSQDCPLGRRRWLAIVAPSGLAALLGGCKALDQLDTSAAAEGTGIQFSAVITVLARYRATPAQRQQAEQRAGTAFVKKSLEPAYRKRRATLVKKSSAAPTAPETIASLAALDQAWYETAVAASREAYRPEINLPRTGTVAFASLAMEKSALLADAKRFSPGLIAVNVRPSGHPSEAAAAGSVMFWNPDRLGLAHDEVYVVNTLPKPGKSARFDTIEAVFLTEG